MGDGRDYFRPTYSVAIPNVSGQNFTFFNPTARIRSASNSPSGNCATVAGRFPLRSYHAGHGIARSGFTTIFANSEYSRSYTFRIAGGKVEVREIHDFTELQNLRERVIVNCTGLGAKALFNDSELTPVKGQLTILLPQPEIDYCTLPEGLYMFPRTDGILLGGTHETGVWSLEPNLEAKQQIVSEHARIFREMR